MTFLADSEKERIIRKCSDCIEGALVVILAGLATETPVDCTLFVVAKVSFRERLRYPARKSIVQTEAWTAFAQG